ncbi:LacI family DNA-binding transcriptional regulator [Tenggerimyces flavus]|uniref:LacI family DNA-binding transcriptional regulator n=1 Tax=Tenggerimyces flavus TaxID=1708749 RepID=A0ABV7YMQ4_9ACTN|nr:LacI family DNA-binding transcriptional regulator [Tenggerimyces flavus]MBM7789556.1 DNA-binding LacI/PurR family transcriptional regulator [Tenggerimyces flavus]
MRPRRVTIADIARRANVSTSAVSYALNDLPGVGSRTRDRILAVADSLGWRPSSAARTLHTARTNTIGLLMLTVERPHGEGADFFVEFLSGVQACLADHDVLLTLHSVPNREIANETYKRWWAEHRVDGVIMLNPLRRDPRIPVLEQLGMPAVVVGDLSSRHAISSVHTDNREATALAIGRLVDLGHRRIARLGIGPAYLHTDIRRRAFAATMRRHGLEPDLSVHLEDDEPPDAPILRMLQTPQPPTAVLIEDSMTAVNAVLGLGTAGIDIPGQLSVIGWDDSSRCRLVRPTVTALRRDIEGLGVKTAELLLRSIAGDPITQVTGATTDLVERDSLAPPRS